MEKANRILTGGYFYAGIFSRKREKGGRSMQIYSAMIPVNESFSKKEFVRLVLEWNQGSHFKEPDIRTAKAFAWIMAEDHRV